MADNMQKPSNAVAELGATGLKRFGGYIYEEWLPDLKGIRATRVYREMGDNDSTIRAMLFAVEMLIRNVKWSFEAFSPSRDDQWGADFCTSCLEDMDQPWSETLAEILSFLRYGWSYHEVVYKYRRGESDDPMQRSKHTDGYLGWRKMPLRSQDSLLRWEFDDAGDLIAMEQIAPPTYRLVKLPVTKCLLFRATTHKANPQGDSILRGAYRSWYMKKHIENIEAIGVERDLAGMPIFWVPPHLLAPDASDEDKKALAEYKRIVTQIKRDEQEGVVMPLGYDENGNKTYDFSLLSATGRRQFDTSGIIRRYDQNMAMTILADFILIGHEKVGSFALNASKQSLFSQAIGAWCGMIADVINRVEIPRLFRLNGFPTDRLPKLMYEEVETVDLEQISQLVTSMAGAGAQLFPDDQLENHLRRQAGWPQRVSPDQAAAGRDLVLPPSKGMDPMIDPPPPMAAPEIQNNPLPGYNGSTYAGGQQRNDEPATQAGLPVRQGQGQPADPGLLDRSQTPRQLDEPPPASAGAKVDQSASLSSKLDRTPPGAPLSGRDSLLRGKPVKKGRGKK